MPVETFDDLSLNNLKKSKTEYIEDIKQINVLYSEQIVHAIMPTDKLIDHLKVSANTPLLQVDHITYNDKDKPIDKVRDIYNSEIYEARFIKLK